MKIIRIIVVTATLFPAAVLAQFAELRPGGPVAIGQVAAQVDGGGHVAIIQAPPVAQAPTSGGIIQLSALGWLEPYVDSLVQVIIALGFAWFGKSRYSQMLDQSSRDALEVFAKNRASSLIADGAVKIEGKAVHVDSGILYRAATESITAIPDALKRFGLTPDIVAAKIIDAIPQTVAGAAIISNAHADNPTPPKPVTRLTASAPGVNPPTSAGL